jgi:hypothetical protein
LGGFVDFAIGAAGIAVCAGTSGVGCGVAFAVAGTAVNTTATIALGAPWDSALGAGVAGVGSIAFGGLGGYLGAAAGGGNTGLSMLAGGIAGAGMAAFFTKFTGGDLGENMMMGAMSGALSAGFTAAAIRENALSQKRALGRPDLSVPDRFRLCGAGRCLAENGVDGAPGGDEPHAFTQEDDDKILSGLGQAAMVVLPEDALVEGYEAADALVEGYEAAEEVAPAVQSVEDIPATFIGQESGPSISVPEGATGPTPTQSPGVQYNGGNGGNGLSGNVTDVRIMDGKGGYVNYGSRQANGGWQSVNPYTGKAISPSDAWWHIPLGN